MHNVEWIKSFVLQRFVPSHYEKGCGLKPMQSRQEELYIVFPTMKADNSCISYCAIITNITTSCR